MSDVLGIVAAVSVVLLMAGIWVWAYYRRKKREAGWPKTWIHLGKPPPDIDIALEVIDLLTPGMTHAGTIEWMDENGFYADGRRVAGLCVGTKPIHVQVSYHPIVEKTALAHELGHAWSILTNQGFGESPADTRFVSWFNQVNREIMKRCGRG